MFSRTWLAITLTASMSIAALAQEPKPVKPKIVKLGATIDKPAFEPGKQSGFFIWKDGDGFHIRWTISDKPILFSGRIDLDRPLEGVTRIKTNGSGWVEKSGDRIVLFSATSRGDIDGIDLKLPKGKRLQMELKIDGAEPKVEQVSFGAKNTHPTGFPLLVYYR